MMEDKVFQRKRPVIELLIQRGFRETPDGYRYETNFMDGEFCAVLQFDKSGKFSGQVIDIMNGEEYAPLRMESYNGAYVNTVRNAYEDLLRDVADTCCTDVVFVAEQSNRIAGLIIERYGVNPDFPFGQSPDEAYGTFRHGDNRKWFALIMNIKLTALLRTANKAATDSGNREENENPDTRVDIVNLKILPEKGETLRSEKGIYPAYHMNHVHWISVVLNDTLPDARVMELVDESFRLTKRGRKDRIPNWEKIHQS